MLREMSRAEFVEWMCFFEEEPFGNEWLQAGTIAAAMAGGSPQKYIPFPKRAQTQEDIERTLTAALATLPKQ